MKAEGVPVAAPNGSVILPAVPEIERKVKTGEPVLQGELLGLSGKTGFTQCLPHLHFQVENSVRADWFTTSVPISFADRDVVSHNPQGIPVEGASYVSENSAPSPDSP